VPIAIVDFAGDRVGADIANVVRNDLQNSGLFRSIPPGSFIQKDINANAPPQFPAWRQIGAAGVVVGQVAQAGGNIKVDFRLWDVVVGNQAAGLSFTSQPANWRRLAHIIADAIYKRVTGEEGYFDTRIAYVAESGPGNARVKRIAVMDQDGANSRFITDGRTIAITPRFSPTLQEIVYMAYAEDRSPPRVYLQNVDSGRRELLGNFPGMSFAPRFSPDGTKVVMSISENGQSDIYEMDVRGRALRRLTNTPAIDTSPCFSNDGSQIVFNSDRGGSPQL
jgi:TolB protein